MTDRSDHWRGCGCKLPGRRLETVLGDFPQAAHRDATSFEVGAGLVVVHSSDFGSVVSDDPRIAARIAIANALSDLYAVGATPRSVDLLLQVPEAQESSIEFCRLLVSEARLVLEEAGVTSVGGHTAAGTDMRFGGAAVGTCPAGELRNRTSAQGGDVLFLTKPLGVGLVLAGFSLEMTGREALQRGLDVAMELNAHSSTLLADACVTCAADVTGFGLLGTLTQIAASSNVRIHVNGVPALGDAIDAAEQGCSSPIGDDTLVWLEDDVEWSVETTQLARVILASPETSGGLVGSCSSAIWDSTPTLRDQSWRIGHIEDAPVGQSGVVVDLAPDDIIRV